MVTPGVMEREVFAVAAMAIGMSKTACVRAAAVRLELGGAIAELWRLSLRNPSLQEGAAAKARAGYGALWSSHLAALLALGPT
eukprot:COSAG04_NODE_19_length_39217_cov_21.535968_20_plen_83_part_00